MTRDISNRPYRMKLRAELQERTRRRITESALELHGTLGPSRTSISAVAEHAGVRRSTLYRHFPDEAARAWVRSPTCPRSHRPRARLRHLALARPGAGPHRRRGGRAHVWPRGGRPQRAPTMKGARTPKGQPSGPRVRAQ